MSLAGGPAVASLIDVRRCGCPVWPGQAGGDLDGFLKLAVGVHPAFGGPRSRNKLSNYRLWKAACFSDIGDGGVRRIRLRVWVSGFFRDVQRNLGLVVAHAFDVTALAGAGVHQFRAPGTTVLFPVFTVSILVRLLAARLPGRSRMRIVGSLGTGIRRCPIVGVAEPRWNRTACRA